jgi:ABC-type lipoprotein export system ATPase subunit
MNSIIEARNLCKEYPLPHNGILCVFKNLNFELQQGDLVAVMGVSGVGKTTLLNLFGALDRPTGGQILLENEDVFTKTERERAEIRNKKIGFVFQFYHLLPEFTALENVCFPLFIKGVDKREAMRRAFDRLEEVNLDEKAQVKPSQLSGGEQQRIAIARALINEPKVLLADEPTGNLDWKTGEKILNIIKDVHKTKDLSSIIVTHNEKVAQFCDKVYMMEDGLMKLFPLP